MGRINNFAFIDGVNLHLTFGNDNIPWEIDYKKLRNLLARRFDITVAYYFLGNVKGNDHLHQDLDSSGYTVKLKTPIRYKTEKQRCPFCKKLISPAQSRHKADYDSLITLQVISDITEYHKAVLITSDGDFDHLVTWLLNRDRLRLVFAPSKKGCSGLLISAARGRIAFIDQYRKEIEKIKERTL